MDEFITIKTPDNVEIEFELAGLGSRAAAYFLDLLTMMFTVLFVYWFINAAVYTSDFDEWVTQTGRMILLLLFYAIQWGYFLFLETVWNGQTVGKKLVGLRVLNQDGTGIRFMQSATRNLLRFADWFPPPTYLLGMIFILINKQGKRLGDLAAGTIVVKEKFAFVDIENGNTSFSAKWMAGVESGRARHALSLPKGTVTPQQLLLIDEYLKRRFQVDGERRNNLGLKIAEQFAPLIGVDLADIENPAEKLAAGEAALEKIIQLAEAEDEATGLDRKSGGQAKQLQWQDFLSFITSLRRRGLRGLRRLNRIETDRLFRSFYQISSDLARARSLGGDSRTLANLNRLTAIGHNIIYSASTVSPARVGTFLHHWATAVRLAAFPVFIAGIVFLGSLIVTAIAVNLTPELAYDIVPESFLYFDPANEEHLHNIPPLARPVASIQYITNNIQVTFLCIAFGLTAGIGTTILLLLNGISIGGVVGWMYQRGTLDSLLGWIMPHGFTELSAIILAGGAGYILAYAIFNPGNRTRADALRLVSPQVMLILAGCMVMLFFAGIIEGSISPMDSLKFNGRFIFVCVSALVWILFFVFFGRSVHDNWTQKPPIPFWRSKLKPSPQTEKDF